MARDTLTETKIKSLKPRNKPYKVSDGTIVGLHVAVSVAGGKVFCLAYRFDNKWRLLRPGAYPLFILEESRDLARDAKKQLAQGVDPAPPQKPRMPKSGQCHYLPSNGAMAGVAAVCFGCSYGRR